MAEKQKKSISHDVVQQFINELTPYLVNFLYWFIPAGIRAKFKGKRMAQISMAALSVLIAKMTPDGGIWDYVDEFRAEFFSVLGRLLTEGQSFGIAPGGGIPSFSSASPEIRQAMNVFQEAVRRVNLFKIDEAPRIRILEWIASLPENEQVGAMEMVQVMSIKEIKRFGKAKDNKGRDIFWKAHPGHPKNQPEKKPSKAEIWFKEMKQALEDFSETHIEADSRRLQGRIDQRRMARAQRRRERDFAFPGRLRNLFRIF